MTISKLPVCSQFHVYYHFLTLSLVSSNLFTTTSVSIMGRNRRTRRTFLQEICICSNNEEINLLNEDWKMDPKYIECQALGCETRVVSHSEDVVVLCFNIILIVSFAVL